jgi:hypothetical protein
MVSDGWTGTGTRLHDDDDCRSCHWPVPFPCQIHIGPPLDVLIRHSLRKISNI